MKTGQEKMDRAQRRQRRLDQRIWGAGERAENGKGRHKHQFGSEASNCESVGKPGWKCNSCGVSERDTPMRRSGPAGPKSLCNACGLKWQQKGAMGGGRSGNVSAEESTDDVTVYEAGLVPSTKGLQAQLNLSDARGLKREKIAAERAGLKWERIAAERAVEIKELKNEIQSLKLVIEEIRESKEVQVELESKLRAENQNLKEKNSELTSGMEVCMQLMHDKIYKKNSDHAAGKGPGNAGRNAHESIAEVNVCNGDQDKGHQQPSKQTGNSGRNGFESAADINVDIEQQGTGCHQGQQTQHLGGNGSGIAKAGHANGSPNECLHKTEKSASLEKDGHDSDADVTIGGIGGQSNDGEGNVSKEPQQAPSVLDMKSGNEPEVLFTAAQRKAALALVDQEFLMWLNSRTRRPTAKEMFFHKSNVDPDRNWSPGEEAYLWTGIPGSLLLDKFHTETDMEKPDCDAVITLLKSVFHIVGGRRADDMLWCLVWADCIKAEQLPGYTSLRPYDTKRARAADDELATRSGKVRRRRHDRLD